MMPKFNEILAPVLKHINDGKEYTTNNIVKEVRDKYFPNMTDEEKERTLNSGRNIFFDRLHWAVTYLNKSGLVNRTKRGVIQVTEEGEKMSKKDDITLDDLCKYESYQEFIKQKRRIKEDTKDEVNTETPKELIDEGINAIESDIKAELLSKLKEINPYDLEKLVGKLLKQMGYGEFIETPKSRDGGIDGIINKDKLGVDKIYIQVKCNKDKVIGSPSIDQFIGAISKKNINDQGIFVTTTDFTSDAKEAIKESSINIVPINGEKLASLLYEYDLGVQEDSTYKIKKLDEDFFEEY